MSREFTKVVAKNIEKLLAKNKKYFSDVKQEINQMKEKNDQNCKCSFEMYGEGELLIHPIEIMQAFSLLLAAYYIFNVDYSKRCKYTLTFLQKHVMKINDEEPITAGLRTVINRLS